MNSLKMPWRELITVGRAADLLRKDLIDHLAYLQRQIGYRRCRFHALFHDDMGVVTRDGDGRLHFHWHHIDKVFDNLLGIGLEPFIELNPMPAALASGDQTIFHYAMNVTPPKDFAEWNGLVRAFVRHCVDRYGIDRVRQWYFEVWNEPNLSGFWSGTQSDYYRLYGEAARAVKSVDSALRIGGPATAGAAWIGDFIDHCRREDLPLDFVSTHSYPQDEQNLFPEGDSPHAPGEYFADTVRSVRQIVSESERPDLEIHWTEWNTQSAPDKASVTWRNNTYVDRLEAAAFIVKNMLALDESCDSLGYWVASDIFEEHGLPQNPFSCTYGLVTNHGLPKASANAFRLLARMTGERVDLPRLPGDGKRSGCLVTRDGDTWKLIAWHHIPPAETADASTETFSVELPAEDGGDFLLTLNHIRAHRGSAWETWRTVGHPSHLTPVEEAALRQAAEPARELSLIRAREHRLALRWRLDPGEVVQMEIRPRPDPASGKGIDPDAWSELDDKLNETVR